MHAMVIDAWGGPETLHEAEVGAEQGVEVTVRPLEADVM